MHSCPRCGMECDCSGDWDDISVMSDDWVWKNCECECEAFEDEDGFDDEYDTNDYDDEDHIEHPAIQSHELKEENPGEGVEGESQAEGGEQETQG